MLFGRKVGRLFTCGELSNSRVIQRSIAPIYTHELLAMAGLIRAPFSWKWKFNGCTLGTVLKGNNLLPKFFPIYKRANYFHLRVVFHQNGDKCILKSFVLFELWNLILYHDSTNYRLTFVKIGWNVHECMCQFWSKIKEKKSSGLPDWIWYFSSRQVFALPVRNLEFRGRRGKETCLGSLIK